MIAASQPDGFASTLSNGEGESGNGNNALGRKPSSIWNDEKTLRINLK